MQDAAAVPAKALQRVHTKKVTWPIPPHHPPPAEVPVALPKLIAGGSSLLGGPACRPHRHLFGASANRPKERPRSDWVERNQRPDLLWRKASEGNNWSPGGKSSQGNGERTGERCGCSAAPTPNCPNCEATTARGGTPPDNPSHSQPLGRSRYFAASSPASRPNTTQSNSELPPRRFRPWMPPTTSPAAQSPAIGLREPF